MKILLHTGNSILDESLVYYVRDKMSDVFCLTTGQGSLIDAINKEKPDILILEQSAGNHEYPSLLWLDVNYPRTSVFLLVPPDYPGEAKVNDLLDGVEGYESKASPLERLFLALQSVKMGQIWAERAIINRITRSLVAERKEKFGKNEDIVTSRESELLYLISKGMSNKEIADKLKFSEKTVKAHLTRIFKKLQVSNRVQAISKYNALKGRSSRISEAAHRL